MYHSSPDSVQMIKKIHRLIESFQSQHKDDKVLFRPALVFALPFIVVFILNSIGIV